MNFWSGFLARTPCKRFWPRVAESPYEIHLHVDREQQTIRAVNHDNDDSESEYDEVPS